MLHYSKSLKAIRSRTESLYDSARRKLTLSGHSESCIAVDDFEAIENDQLSVTKGQRLEVVELCQDTREWVLVSYIGEGGEQRQGLVPASVLSSTEPSGIYCSCSAEIIAACSHL
uniref:SH3 domain-containing protein n=1 Tax=Ascaris lumbricoides TaxID=6252 RepID=A0A0M3HPD1_ASCLU